MIRDFDLSSSRPHSGLLFTVALATLLGSACGPTTSTPADTDDGTGSSSSSTTGTSSTTSGTSSTPGDPSDTDDAPPVPTTGGPGDPDPTTTGGSTGSTGDEPSLPGDTDADAVQWPAACQSIASEDAVCLTFGLDGVESELHLYAVSLDSGASCILADVAGIDSFDAPDSMAWIEDGLAWPGDFEAAGRRLDLNTGEIGDIDATEVRFAEYDGGLLVAGGTNWPYYDDFDALEAAQPAETFAVGLSGRPVVVGDTIYTFDYDGTPGGGYDMQTQSAVPGLLLDFVGTIDGLAPLEDGLAVLADGTVHLFDADGTPWGVQPLNVDGARGLACSRGVTESSS